MSRLNSDLGGDAVLERAIELLNPLVEENVSAHCAEANHPLFQPFYAALRVVDFARSCLASGYVKEALFQDDFLKALADDSDLEFGFTPGVFSDRPVRSEAEFIACRARSRENVGPAEGDVERRTAWLFLACGRIPDLSGRNAIAEVADAR